MRKLVSLRLRPHLIEEPDGLLFRNLHDLLRLLAIDASSDAAEGEHLDVFDHSIDLGLGLDPVLGQDAFDNRSQDQLDRGNLGERHRHVLIDFSLCHRFPTRIATKEPIWLTFESRGASDE